MEDAPARRPSGRPACRTAGLRRAGRAAARPGPGAVGEQRRGGRPGSACNEPVPSSRAAPGPRLRAGRDREIDGERAGAGPDPRRSIAPGARARRPRHRACAGSEVGRGLRARSPGRLSRQPRGASCRQVRCRDPAAQDVPLGQRGRPLHVADLVRDLAGRRHHGEHEAERQDEGEEGTREQAPGRGGGEGHGCLYPGPAPCNSARGHGRGKGCWDACRGIKSLSSCLRTTRSRTLRRTNDEIPRDIVDDVILTDDASRDDTAGLAQHWASRRSATRGTAATAATRRPATPQRSPAARTSS